MAKGQVAKKRNSSPAVIDWPGIRSAALVVGVREAARRAAVNLTLAEKQRFVNRILRRSCREKWLEGVNKSTRPDVPHNALPLSSAVITGAEILENVLRENSEQTKKALSIAGRNAAEHLAQSKPRAVVRQHHALRNITSAMSDVHGWAEKGSSGGPQLNVLNIQVDARSLTVNRSSNSPNDV